MGTRKGKKGKREQTKFLTKIFIAIGCKNKDACVILFMNQMKTQTNFLDYKNIKKLIYTLDNWAFLLYKFDDRDK